MGYTVGELIVPQKFVKLKIDNQNNIVREEFEVSGRKIPLLNIRKKQYEQNKQFYRIYSEQQIKEMDRCAIVKELMRINEFHEADSSICTYLLKEGSTRLPIFDEKH